MAVETVNVSGIRALRWILTGNDQFFFTNAVDGQKLLLTFQQDATGSRVPTSGNCPGLIVPNGSANVDSTQELTYDSAQNAWNAVPQNTAVGNMVQNVFTTNTSISWSRGLVALSGAAAITLTITNPISGAPGVGNDGEIMWFTALTAHTHTVTMTTTQSINGSSTSAQIAGVVGNAVGLMAFGGKVLILSSQGALTLT